MTTAKKTKVLITSIKDFDKIFYPKSYKKSLVESYTDPEIIGAILAKETLREAKTQLRK
jgi:hypothetical protein